jgi:hypothetical protein
MLTETTESLSVSTEVTAIWRNPGQAGGGLTVVAAQLLLPVFVGFDLVHEHRAVFPAMPGQIALPIPVDVEPPHHPRAVYRVLQA